MKTSCIIIFYFPLILNIFITQKISAINGTDNNCPPQLVHTKDSAGWFEKIHGCGVPCENPIFTEEEHGRIRRFIGAFGSLSMLCTAFTVVSKKLCNFVALVQYPH